MEWTATNAYGETATITAATLALAREFADFALESSGDIVTISARGAEDWSGEWATIDSSGNVMNVYASKSEAAAGALASARYDDGMYFDRPAITPSFGR